MQRPIFILGAHKSGTSLLRSLFDGHPDLITVPVEAHFFQHAAWWVDYAYRRTLPVPVDREGFIDRATRWVQRCNTSEDPQGDSVARGVFDVPRFRASLTAALPPSSHPREAPALYLEAYFSALHESVWGRPPEAGRRFVEKSVEHAEFAADLHAFFPDARFVHLVRNPYANLVSLRAYKADGRYPWIGPAIRSLYNAFYFLYRNRRRIAPYHVLTYEDLVQHPERSVEALCAFLDLDRRDSLLQPTFLGRPWGGNSTSDVTFTGISAARIARWRDDILPLEAALVNKYLPHVLRDFGYERFEPTGSVYRRAPGEPLKHYLANRLVWRATQY